METLIQAVKDHAIKNYEKGWDVVVECYTDDEIKEAIGKARTEKGAIKKVGVFVGLYEEKRREIEATIF